jgi:hypothetical protein
VGTKGIERGGSDRGGLLFPAISLGTE